MLPYIQHNLLYIDELIASILFLSFLVLRFNNIVYSLVCLIGAFFFSALLFLLVHLEFLGYVLIVVYVGAIAILFLFVVMTLDINQEEFIGSVIQSSKKLKSVSHWIGAAFFFNVSWIISQVVFPFYALLLRFDFVYDPWTLHVVTSGTLAIAVSLYTFNFIYLLVAGLLLLVAMVGATILVLEPKSSSDRFEQTLTSSYRKKPTQNTSKQSYRKTGSAVNRSTIG